MCNLISQNGPTISAWLNTKGSFKFEAGGDWKPGQWMVGQTHPYLPIVFRDNETQKSAVQLAQWGLVPFWLKESDKVAQFQNWNLNARSETIDTKASFRAPARYRRCVIPVSAFLEWQHRPGIKKAFPHTISVKDKDITFLAGLYDSWGTMTSCTIVTMPANTLMKTIHNGGSNPFRQPVIVPEEWIDDWIGPGNIDAVRPLFIPRDDLGLVAVETQKPAS